jgi:hypothetical protein
MPAGEGTMQNSELNQPVKIFIAALIDRAYMRHVGTCII